MFRGKYVVVAIFVILAVFLVVSFPMNEWFSETMSRHQLLQLPVMIVLGAASALTLNCKTVNVVSWGIAILIFIAASVVFWMLPRSIDLAVIHPLFNRVMHFNMMLVGFLLAPVLRGMVFEIRILFIGMMSVMLLATGFALKTFDVLLCSSFTIQQQHETGFYLILVGFSLFVITVVIFFKGLNPGNIAA